MANIAAAGQRIDPYSTHKFRLYWDGECVAGVSSFSGLKRTTEMAEYRSGGDPSGMKKKPTLTKFEPVTLKRGITHSIEFEQWANKVWYINNAFGAETSIKDFRKDITLEMYNEAGQVALRYFIFNCWVSEFVQVPELSADSPAIAIEEMKLEHEGFVRDYDLVAPEPVEFFEPAAG